ncbi:MAG TPA: hypothetical protein VFQ85_09070 [Mycobacteriales bacterium]|jgi:hypothetical protein|nr:hypothetical protein [Mycobacteriales bacterium]
MNAALFAAGLAIVLATWMSVLRTLVVPRGLSSRLTAGVTRAVRGTFDLLAGRFDRYETKDRILVAQGPTVLVVLLAAWVLLFLTGFLLMFAGMNGASFLAAFRESGSSVFTLGSAATPRLLPTVVELFAAATGLVVVALQIAYLPTLYGSFNRRETLVTLLQSRAGAPAWGPELLARHQIVATLDNLPAFFAEWERWSADVAESHTNYPVLITFRSPDPYRSWIVGLLAVLDAAALRLALNPSARQSEARLCLRMGFTCVRDICRSLGIPYDPDPLPDTPIALSYDDFLRGVERLRDVGYEIEREPAAAWPHFRGWRVNYEQQCYAIARATDAVPAVWSGPRRHSAEPMLPVRPPNRTPGSKDAYTLPKPGS